MKAPDIRVFFDNAVDLERLGQRNTRPQKENFAHIRKVVVEYGEGDFDPAEDLKHPYSILGSDDFSKNKYFPDHIVDMNGDKIDWDDEEKWTEIFNARKRRT